MTGDDKTAEARGPFRQWAILELMGHRKAAGLVQEVDLFGGKLLRIDIPEGGRDQQQISQLYGAASIYCLTIVDEETAKAFARSYRDAPLEEWSARRMLEPPADTPKGEAFAGVDDDLEDNDGDWIDPDDHEEMP